MFKAKLISIALVLGLLMGLIGTGHAVANDPPPFLTPGVVSGTGTHFEVTDSKYLNVVLDSTKTIRVVLTSVPKVDPISWTGLAQH